MTTERQPNDRVNLVRAWLHLAVLCGFVLAQPAFDVISNSPEFFAERGTNRGEALAFALGLILLPPTILVGLEAILGLIGWRARFIGHLVFVGVLSAAFALALLKRVASHVSGGDELGWLLVAAALAAGTGAVWLYARQGVARTFLDILSPAPLVFLALFLQDRPPTKDPDLPVVSAAKTPVPVVMVVLDELPTVSLLDSRGAIDAQRFPAFANLARHSTWYENASSTADFTNEALPAILAGRRTSAGREPIYQSHPQNLFTLLHDSYRIRASESVTRLCPGTVCAERVDRPLPRRLADLGWDALRLDIQYTAPVDFAESLPRVPGLGDPTLQFERFIHGLRPARAGVFDFVHVVLPHVPYVFLPSGRRHTENGSPAEFKGLSSATWVDDPKAVRAQWRRHLLQVAYTDRLLGKLIARMKRQGSWERALLIVTADHGMSFLPGRPARTFSKENIGETAAVPIFVKRPGQTRGAISSARVQITDIAPTLAEVVGIETPWKVDGHPLLRPVDRERLDVTSSHGPRVTVSAKQFDRAKSSALKRRLDLFGAGPLDRVYSGPRPDLIGRSVSGLHLVRLQLDQQKDLERVSEDSLFVPARISGSIQGAVPSGCDILALSVNGTIRATESAEGGNFDVVVPESALRSGKNVVTAALAPSEGQSGCR